MDFILMLLAVIVYFLLILHDGQVKPAGALALIAMLVLIGLIF